ncbi:hypothetical protein [Sphingomonas segetis]|uniref:hypothetical protein n=1 Tax=Sphingomonas segetis TaxID=1104779 RepID=UPI0012D34948|nr:hypothetical protein [Sphingomonas segetis]
MLIVRRVLVVVLALLLAVQVVRNAAVAALAPLRPASAARFWAGHPSVEIARGLAEIGTASRERRPIDPHVFRMFEDAAAKSPLSPEPFLVRGVRAQTAGNGKAAKAAFLAAQWRDPRSMPAAYFLAGYYLRSGPLLKGLKQVTILARLSPNGAGAAAPFVAAYAKNRSNWPEMRALFRSQPALENDVLTALARDARNAEAILALADAEHRTPESNWLPILLSNLVASGDYVRARAIWSSVGAGPGRAGEHDLVFDPGFSMPEPPPPFNWSFGSSDVGIAERQRGRKLHVIFYGNVDGPLASQLVLLPAGRYRLQMQLAGSSAHPELLRWSIRCDKSSEPIADIPIDQAAVHGWTFEIPANCPAQRLELIGRSADVAQQAEATVTDLRLTRAGSDA